MNHAIAVAQTKLIISEEVPSLDESVHLIMNPVRTEYHLSVINDYNFILLRFGCMILKLEYGRILNMNNVRFRNMKY